MKISKQEQTILAKLKYLEGKDYKTIKRELERDNNFMHDAVSRKKNLVKEVTSLIIQKDKLKNEINGLLNKKLKVTIANMDFTEDKIKDDSKKRKAFVKHLYRILNYLEENGNSRITKLFKDCMISNSSAKECLHFLIRYNLVKELNNNGTSSYEIVKLNQGGQNDILPYPKG